jgi:aminoglycoside 6'-N-acetyltransferase
MLPASQRIQDEPARRGRRASGGENRSSPRAVPGDDGAVNASSPAATVAPPAERIPGPRVVLERAQARHVEALRRIHELPEVASRWPRMSDAWPLDDDADTIGYAVVLREDGRVHGFVQYAEDDDPDYRSGSIDVFIDPAVHGRGLGREVVALTAAYLIDGRGHHRVTIDPATTNTAAIRAYAAVGFRPVGVMRRYERGPDGTWHDGLLMDLLADELVRPEGGPATPR